MCPGEVAEAQAGASELRVSDQPETTRKRGNPANPQISQQPFIFVGQVVIAKAKEERE